MLVYGEAERIEDPRAKRDALVAELRAVERMPPGLDRHAALVAAFIEAGEWVQGLADAEFHARGRDGPSKEPDAAMHVLLGLAAAVGRSWSSGFKELAFPESLLAEAGQIGGPATITTKQAEGYAFYALYPELYYEAARRSGLPPDTRVIGVRSIGTGLAAIVAAALGARAPVTLRPVGHPFRREVRIDGNLARHLLGRPTCFAIVDEGPGLSGSSFGAVADWLEGHGVGRDRIHFFPSHGGLLGPQASEAHRQRWAAARRHLVGFEEILPQRLASWAEGLIGRLDEPLQEMSGGAWRRTRAKEAWPAANLQQERRKFIGRAGGGAWLIKFAGLGREGARKLDLAQQLAGEGFVPPPRGLCHGFLIEPWIEDARALDQVEVDRRILIERMAAYLGCRTRLNGGERRGASAERLIEMARHNTKIALGEEAARRLHFHPVALEARMHRVLTDGRMLPHEWLLTGDGRLLKSDALDHHTAHDLIGCQDIAWDVAGAAVEFALSDDETQQLAEAVGHAARRPVDPDLLAFLIPCYLAFRMGACALAADANGGEEAERLRRAADRYKAMLERCVSSEPRFS